MKFFTSLLFLVLASVNSEKEICEVAPSNNCITFTVSQGTGCAWMCNYCANQLGN